MTDDDCLPNPATRTEGEGETLDMPEGMRPFIQGQVLGERYRILEMLGRGGMGEVWHAFDLKLRVEVALKALRGDLFKSERRLELLRQEVRAAREVVSPNVCRIFDLIEVGGRELVSMEYVDGATLLGVLQERGPLELKEAQDIASQFLAGLEAIHKVGLIHRDIKPENIMLTRAGRVVVMDFGLARQEAEGGGSVSGTPAYMAPEQAAGQTVDARADVYAAGVVLAEMVSPDGIQSFESRQSLWEGVRSEPAKLPDSPWAPVIQQAVKKDREGRFNSAHTLTRALEDVTLRVEGAEDLHPYPGLASFTESDAEYFFGREAEVEQMWRRLDRPHLLGIVGPSGAGKTSFIRAGLIPSAGTSWAIATCTPGNAAIASLRRALASEIADDSAAVGELAVGDPDSTISAYSRWRARHDQAVLIVDQFEELFTLNPAEEQREFAKLLERLVLEADVFVLLSMRDDFLMQCRDHKPLEPIFSDLTALPTLAGGALRRAIVQPATKCGYRFEDDELVDEMLADVERERGALPMLAFAAARLWEMRDRETGLLTRQAYQDIGGVGGALARHAEATIERIGTGRITLVRELFRNLVTAEGTRAAREWDELLSVFDESQHQSAENILRELINARLLTSYEVREDEHEPTRRLEIIHESLLANWPRLVRWQTQDADAAQLRDQLRRAARTWDEQGRSDDTLWTGSAYREFASWRERYPGGLTEIEGAFSAAMTSFATRRRHRRRIAAAAALILAVGVASVFGVLWRRSVLETRRAEAAQLVSLGQLELDSYPSSTVAHAIASLEHADSPGARHLALKALLQGPTALVATEDFAWRCRFGPDGRWLVQTEFVQAERAEGLLSIVRSDGSREYPENAHCETTHAFLTRIWDGGHFVSFTTCEDLTWQYVLWSMPDGRPLADVRYKILATGPHPLLGIAWDTPRDRLVLMALENGRAVVDVLGYDGSVRRLGTLEFPFSTARAWRRSTALDRDDARWGAAVVDNELLVFDIGDDALSVPRRLGRVNARIAGFHAKGRWLSVLLEDEALMFDIDAEGPSEPRRLRPVDGADAGWAIDPLGRFVAASGATGEIRLWNLPETAPPVVLEGPQGVNQSLSITDDGSRLEAYAENEGRHFGWVWSLSGKSPRFLRRFDLGGATGWGGWKWDTEARRVARWGLDKKVRVWSMGAPADAEPLVLSRGNNEQVDDLSFNPRGGWLATADFSGLSLWPLARPYPVVIRRHDSEVGGLAFAPDGSWVASSSSDGTVRLWPLDGEPPPPGRTLLEIGERTVGLAASPDGERVLVSTQGEGTWVLRPDGGIARKLEGIIEGFAVAFSPDGRLAAAAGGVFGMEERRIGVWDVASGERLSFLEVGEMVRLGLQFTPNGRLLSASESGLLRWNVETGEREILYKGIILGFAASTDGRRVIMVEGDDVSDNWGRATLFDLDSLSATRLDGFGNDVKYVALDRTGTVAVAGDHDGEVRVGLVSGGEPHLFVGHEGSIWSVAIDPLARWVASGSDDQTLRLWPMPDLTKPPLHTLPREELIAKLKTLTNLRAVRDEESATGWKVEIGPFPGWETVPEW